MRRCLRQTIESLRESRERFIQLRNTFLNCCHCITNWSSPNIALLSPLRILECNTKTAIFKKTHSYPRIFLKCPEHDVILQCYRYPVRPRNQKITFHALKQWIGTPKQGIGFSSTVPIRCCGFLIFWAFLNLGRTECSYEWVVLVLSSV